MTKDDVVIPKEVDEGIVAFICYMRDRMQWDNKKLDQTEIEVIFGMLNKEHNKIIEAIRKLINSIASDNIYGKMPPDEKHGNKGDKDSDVSDSSDY